MNADQLLTREGKSKHSEAPRQMQDWLPKKVFKQRSGKFFNYINRSLRRIGNAVESLDFTLDDLRRWIRSQPMECDYCGEPVTTENFSVDHAQPTFNNGRQQLANLRICCVRCNKAKSTLPEEEYRKLLKAIQAMPHKYQVETFRRLTYGAMAVKR